MIKAVIFDCFGVLIHDDGSKNTPLLNAIKELKDTYKTAVVSNVGKGGLHRYFSEHELQTLFDVAIASGDVGMLKPDPEIFRHVTERLEVEPEECVFIDDNEGHCNGAEAVGMEAIQYQGLEQAKIELEQLLRDSER